MKKHNLRYIAAAGMFLIAALAGILWFTRDKDPYVTKAAPDLPAPPLKELAERRGVQVGNFASLKYLRERPYTDILTSEFEHLIIDGEPNWKFEDFTFRPSRESYDFAHLDQVFDFADQHDMSVRVQHLLWGDEKWLPDWLKQGNYSKEELLTIIKEHIDTVGAKYKGRVREYTVVNEAFSRKLQFGGNRDWWGERLGYDYIDQAFVWARAADPGAILILNDFNNEKASDSSNLMYEYVRDAKARGIPIDGVGMQMHLDGANPPTKDEVAAQMRRFASLGVRIYVTEFDVNMHGLQKDKQEEDQIQAKIYGDMVGACLDVGAEVCPSFGFLGLIDRQTWYRGIGQEDANPLMFNEDYSPKPAFFKTRETFEGR
jgi:endo-1,4-beta-xylanase